MRSQGSARMMALGMEPYHHVQVSQFLPLNQYLQTQSSIENQSRNMCLKYYIELFKQILFQINMHLSFQRKGITNQQQQWINLFFPCLTVSRRLDRWHISLIVIGAVALVLGMLHINLPCSELIMAANSILSPIIARLR